MPELQPAYHIRYVPVTKFLSMEETYVAGIYTEQQQIVFAWNMRYNYNVMIKNCYLTIAVFLCFVFLDTQITILDININFDEDSTP